MRSQAVRRLIVVSLLVVPLELIAENPRSPLNTPEFSTVVASPDVKAPLTNKDLNACVREAARVMKLEDRDRPQIVILQIAPAEAKRLGLTHTVLLSNRGTTPPNTFYEVWIVGHYALGDLVRGVETVYELHFGLHYTDRERAKIVKRIANTMGSTIGVNALREESENSDTR